MDLTHDDDDTNPPMSGIPLPLPASAHISSNNCALVTFAQAGGNPTPNVHSLQPIPNQTAANPWQVLYPATYTLQFLDLQKLFNWLHNEHEMLCTFSATRFDMLCPINKGNFLLPIINMKRPRGKTFSILWREIAQYTSAKCRCKFGNSNMKQVRDFPNDKGKCCRDVLRQRQKYVVERKFQQPPRTNGTASHCRWLTHSSAALPTRCFQRQSHCRLDS